MGCVPSAALGDARSMSFHKAFKLGKKLGEGAFGQVRIAKARSSEEELAVKIVDVRCTDCNGNPTGEAERGRLSATRGEIKMWEAIPPNDFCVRLQSSYFEKNIFYMVMERCQCSLMDKLSSLKTMVEGNLVRIFRDMLEGLRHVHEAGIVHRDVKADNYLIGGPDGSLVKICDFGLAARKPSNGTRLKGVFGTAPYMSPEMLQRKGYDELIDIWSYGATVFLLIHGDFPYSCRNPTPTAMKRMILEGVPEIQFHRDPLDEDRFFERGFTDRVTALLRMVLRRAPETRPSAKQALKHPIFQPIDSSDEGMPPLEVPVAPPLSRTMVAQLPQQELGTPRKPRRRACHDDSAATPSTSADTPSTMTGGGASCQASPVSPETGFAWGSAVTAEALGLHQVRKRLNLDGAADSPFSSPGSPFEMPGRSCSRGSLAEAHRPRELSFPSPRPWSPDPAKVCVVEPQACMVGGQHNSNARC